MSGALGFLFGEAHNHLALRWQLCFSKRGFKQPAIVLCTAAGWMRFWAHDTEEVCLSSKFMRGQNQQPVPGKKVSHADEVQDENRISVSVMSFFGDF